MPGPGTRTPRRSATGAEVLDVRAEQLGDARPGVRSELAHIPIDTAGITLRPKGLMPIQPARH